MTLELHRRPEDRDGHEYWAGPGARGALACAVPGCGRDAVGFVVMVDRLSEAEVYIGLPISPGQIPICLEHLLLGAVPRRSSKRPLPAIGRWNDPGPEAPVV